MVNYSSFYFPEDKQQGMVQGTKTKLVYPAYFINKLNQQRETGIAGKGRGSDLKKINIKQRRVPNTVYKFFPTFLGAPVHGALKQTQISLAFGKNDS